VITVGDSPAAGSARWPALREELDRWGDKGRIATLWWRDDDAAAPSRRLDDLLATAGTVPVALAVIPALADRTLAAALQPAARASVCVLQHGWRHRDNSGGGKKSEFPPARPSEETAADLTRARARLAALFGARALAVLAPPWNRFDDSLLPLLAATGIRGVSRVKPRRAAWPCAGVFAANVHVDLVAWRGDRGFVGEAAALAGLTGHLRARRLGTVDDGEPTGILTHHLVQDERTGAFLGRLLELTCGHRAARWLDARAVFAPAFAAAPDAGQTVAGRA
jgi:peptidoglycan/xylan/chitin deacetylase (PgdA/CDA1 family)